MNQEVYILNKTASIILGALIVASALPVLASSAQARGWGHHSYRHHSYHRRSNRGETCWRTNRMTGAHFRIC